MPIYDNSKYTVQSTAQGLTNAFIYSEKAENAIQRGVKKFNNSLFGDKSSTYFEITTPQSSLSTIQDCNSEFISDAGTKAGFVKNLTGMYEKSSYEASINFNPKGNTTYQAFANIDGTVGAGVKFKNGDRITGAYTVGSGAELAYSTNTNSLQTKTGLFYDQYRKSTGVASVVAKQLSSNISFEGSASVDNKGNWSTSVSTNIAQKHNNIKLNAGIQNDEGQKSGFIGAIITF